MISAEYLGYPTDILPGYSPKHIQSIYCRYSACVDLAIFQSILRSVHFLTPVSSLIEVMCYTNKLCKDKYLSCAEVSTCTSDLAAMEKIVFSSRTAASHQATFTKNLNTCIDELGCLADIGRVWKEDDQQLPLTNDQVRYIGHGLITVVQLVDISDGWGWHAVQAGLECQQTGWWIIEDVDVHNLNQRFVLLPCGLLFMLNIDW